MYVGSTSVAINQGNCTKLNQRILASISDGLTSVQEDLGKYPKINKRHPIHHVRWFDARCKRVKQL